MAYDDTLPDNQNWVRHLIRDTSTSPRFSDDEIDAWLLESRAYDGRGAKKWDVASGMLDLLLVSNLQQSTDVSEKEVDELTLKFGSSNAAAEVVLRSLAAKYARRAARLSRRKPSRFRVIRPPAVAGVDTIGLIADRIV